MKKNGLAPQKLGSVQSFSGIKDLLGLLSELKNDDIYTAKQLAEHLNVQTGTLRLWARTDPRIKKFMCYVKIGSHFNPIYCSPEYRRELLISRKAVEEHPNGSR